MKAVRYQQIKASFFDHHKNGNIKASNRGKIPQIQCRLRYHQLDFRVLMKALRRIASPFLKLLSPLPRLSSYAANLKVISLSMRRLETKLRSSVCLKWREISVAVVLGNDGMQIFLSVISNKYPTILVVFLMRRSCFPAKCRQTIFGWTQHLRVEVLYPKPSGNANVFYWSNFLFSGL